MSKCGSRCSVGCVSPNGQGPLSCRAIIPVDREKQYANIFLKNRITSARNKCSEENTTELLSVGWPKSLSKEWILKLTWILKRNQPWEDLDLSRPGNSNSRFLRPSALGLCKEEASGHFGWTSRSSGWCWGDSRIFRECRPHEGIQLPDTRQLLETGHEVKIQ